MKKVIIRTALVAAGIAMLAASCTKQELRQEPTVTTKNLIEVRSYNAGSGTQFKTKSAIYGSVMPIERDLVISAYYNDPEGSSSTEYFKNYLFSYSSEKQTWTSVEEPVYWPLKGTLDFLAYSSEDAQIKAQWDEDNCADEAVLGNFKESLSLSDDLLYAKANGQTYSVSGVPMEFGHAKSLIVFTAKSSNVDAITITKIEINDLEQIDNAKTQLTITNNGAEPATAEWNKEYKAAADVVVPGIDGISYNVPVKPMDVKKKSSYLGIGGQGILVPEQEMKSFTVYFEQKGADENVIKESFTYDCKIGEAEDSEWQMGKRYIYELNFKVNEIEVAASVVPWDDEAVDGNVVFDDAVFEAYCLENYDLNGDGVISYSEAEAVTEMEFDTNGMDNLRGIEYFTNLEKLICCLDGDYYTLDENNKRHFYDEEDNEIFGLNTLDVSHNDKLYFLDCADNQLKVIDVSKNIKLEYFWCGGNSLRSLDVTQNTLLTMIDFSDNELTEIDLSNNTALTSLGCDGNLYDNFDFSIFPDLEYLDCNHTKLSGIDISNNTKLKELECENNQLTSLDLSNNTKLKRIWCDNSQLESLILGENISLKTLYCENNKLTALDLSKNTSLETLDCFGNLLESLDLSNNLEMYNLDCNPMPNMTTLYLAKGQTISYMNIPAGVNIIRVGE